MRVEFATARLEKFYRDHRWSARQLGAQVAQRLINRIDALEDLERFDDVHRMPDWR